MGLAGTAQVFISRSSEVESYYDSSSELIVKDTIEEALPDIESLLLEPSRRHDLALAIQARTKQNHTYDHRVQRIVDDIVGLEKKGTRAEVNRITPRPTHKRRRILFVAHNIEGKRPGGGVEVYLNSLNRNMRQHYDVYILVPERLGNRTILELVLPDGSVTRHETRHSFSSEYISAPEIEAILFEIIIKCCIELVHFHHLMHLPISLPHVAKLAGARTVITVHDYYLICDNFNLVSYEGRFCEFNKRSATYCDMCLLNTKSYGVGTQVVRRNAIARILNSVDLIIFNTEYSRSLFRELYTIPDNKSAIIEMLMPEERYYPSVEDDDQDHSEYDAPLAVKIPGNFTSQKAALPLFNVMQALRDANIEFDILGREEDSVRQALDAAGNSKIRRHHGYQQSELAALLAGGDVSINFSIWPETYMISLSEAWAAGLVPIVSDLGAPAERVTHGVDGFVISHNDPGKIVEVLRVLEHDRSRMLPIKANIRQKRIVRTNEHVAMLNAEYERLMAPLVSRPISVRARERVSFDRFMYAERHVNNKWTDPTTLWDQDYNSRHLSQGWDMENVPAFPVANLPMKYAHLSRDVSDNFLCRKVKRIEERKISGGLRLEKEVRFRIDALRNRELVEIYHHCVVSGCEMVSPMRLVKETSGSIIVEINLSGLLSYNDESLIMVYDGLIVEYTNLDMLPDRSGVLSNDVVGFDQLPLEYIEGCDRLQRVGVRDGILSVEGWAFDPVAAQVPPECHLCIVDDSGQSLSFRVKRVSDSAIGIMRPIFGYSGFGWLCPTDHLQSLRSSHGGKLFIHVVQKVAGRRITSGMIAEISLDPLRPGQDGNQIAKIYLPETGYRDVSDGLRSLVPGISEGAVGYRKKLLAEAVDARMLASGEFYRGLSGEARRNLLTHYILGGERAGQAPMIDFDPGVYAKNNPEIADEPSLLLHYLEFGQKEGRISSKMSPPVLSKDANLIRPYLDKRYYHQQAFGTTRFSGDLAQHYIAFGEANNLLPNAEFDPAYYRKSNADIKRGTCLFAHYIVFGKEEGRRPSASSTIKSTHAERRADVLHTFDVEHYLKQVPYLVGTDIDPICHFFQHGVHNRLSPNPDFTREMPKANGSSVAQHFVEWSRRLRAHHREDQ